MGGVMGGDGSMAVIRFWICLLIAALICCELGEASSRTNQVHKVLMENGNNSETVSALTARTERIDPLDSFKRYRGGYNITNKHYWSSTIFTGKYGYSIAAIWLIGGLVLAGILLITSICYKKKEPRVIKRPLCLKRYCIWPILIAVLFTLLALVASGIVLGGSIGFHSRARSIKGIIVATAEEATGTIYNVTEVVKEMQQDTELQGYLNESTSLNATLQELNDEAASILNKAKKNMHLVDEGLKILEVVTIVTVVLNIIIILALLASVPLRLRRALHMLIIVSWAMTTLLWIYFGLYFFLHKFAGDTCAALDEYRINPENSSLSSILPCSDQNSARSILRDTGAGIHDLINQVNANISRLQSSSLPDAEYVCNPISGPPEYNYQPENCSSSTNQVGDIPQILKVYTCSLGTCRQGEFISASDYSRVLVYTSSIQNILDAFPGMESLVNCGLVKDAFSKILFQQCKPLESYAHMSWASLAALSTVMVALVLIWTFRAHHDRRCHSSDGSVKPQQLTARELAETTSEV